MWHSITSRYLIQRADDGNCHTHHQIFTIPLCWKYLNSSRVAQLFVTGTHNYGKLRWLSYKGKGFVFGFSARDMVDPLILVLLVGWRCQTQQWRANV